MESDADAPATAARLRDPAAAFRARAALLIALGLLDVGLLLRWLATPAWISGFTGWMALRALMALLAIAVVGFTGRRGGPLAAGRGADPPLTLAPTLMLAAAVGAWCFVLPIFGAAIACIVTARPPAGDGTASDEALLWPAPVRWDNPGLK